MDNLSFFDSMAEKWDQNAIHDLEKVDFIVSSANIKPNDFVLDLGSGTGILIPFIKKHIGIDGRITALDISPKMIEIAKRKNGSDKIEYVCSDLYKYESHEKYSIIIAYSCFPHFSDHELFFNKCNELLNRNGRLILAHSESKEKINGEHQEIDDKLKSNYLESAKFVATEAEKIGFKSKLIIDNEEYYLIILEK